MATPSNAVQQDESFDPFKTRDRIARNDSIAKRNSLLIPQQSMPNLRRNSPNDRSTALSRASRATANSDISEGFWAGFSNNGRPISLEEGDLPTPVAFDEVMLPTVYRQMQEAAALEANSSPFDTKETEEEKRERERRLKLTEKWYEAQRRREYEAKYGKPPPSDQPSRPPKSPARTGSRSGSDAFVRQNSGSSGRIPRAPSHRYPSSHGSHLDVGVSAYPSPPGSSYASNPRSYDEMSTPFAQGHDVSQGMMLPQRQAPAPARNNSIHSAGGAPPPRPAQPAPALTNYGPATMHAGPSINNNNGTTAPVPDKAGCCTIL
ncbi:hypothetical protein BDF19DRAFT_414855 [Syncephalis fuscata]|nr:hypothetical protein BDF19DRAFT_414855 [Syncephalis fuscata]